MTSDLLMIIRAIVTKTMVKVERDRTTSIRHFLNDAATEVALKTEESLTKEICSTITSRVTSLEEEHNSLLERGSFDRLHMSKIIDEMKSLENHLMDKYVWSRSKHKTEN